jgi:homoserine O-acetyltransferase
MKTFLLDNDFILESGEVISSPVFAYHTFGKLNKDKSNVVWVCHAFTANSDVFSWWDGLFGNNCLFNPGEHFIVCANILGSCYGTTGPLSINPQSNRPYYHTFPNITIRDLVNAHIILKRHLGINNINTLIGGSMGGQQALEWAIIEPNNIQNLLLIATNVRHSPWGIAFNEAQRMAIKADGSITEESEKAGIAGMKAARAIAMMSYRNYLTFSQTQNDQEGRNLVLPKAAAYQQYQGEKLATRFNAFSYITLSKTMDSHDITRNRANPAEVLTAIKANTLIMSISNDILFPPEEQLLLAQLIPNATYKSINSIYGHDGFLIETAAITKEILAFKQSILQTFI